MVWCVQRATSEKARETLEDLLVEKDESEVKGKISIVELDEDEFESCLFSVCGRFRDLTTKELKDASVTNRSGPFGILTSKKEGERWVSLPMFQPFVAGVDMTVVTLEDMKDLQDFGAKSGGPGVLVVDRVVNKSQIDTESLYAITLDDQEVSFVSGQELLDKVEIVGDDNLTVLAKALMACKPPGKKSDWGDATAVVSNVPSE